MQEKKKDLQNQPQTIKKMAIGTYMSIITLNVNGLNAPTPRHRLSEWLQKQDPYICCLQETHFRLKDAHRLKMEDGKIYTMKWEAKENWSGNQAKVLRRWMKLEPIIQSEVSQKDKDQYSILTHIYGI